jgi:hypothetical protein
MASNGNNVMQAIAPVISAYERTIQPSTKQQKTEALQFLESFQKSVCNSAGLPYLLTHPVQAEAWTILFQMLQLESITGPVQMFAATSLKGKASLDVQSLLGVPLTA